MQVLKPILEGKLSCRTIPQNTYSLIIQPLLKLGEFDQAILTANNGAKPNVARSWWNPLRSLWPGWMLRFTD
ncbi:hypothetical protein GCM10008018_52800 [Paenibacillus marchantiophytorum]|uniref:Uncharacterized protein n=1 Tax=Paenibacillus marchantiophytorum TaxID=1619310 RepID=A0ABQ1F5E9_9BACL|nr:hypothetical protein [Paenibacillus marchantiophytorum]GFZ99988.1 hypothetical protein GCM10008018_52800 [Paenibacillus marchantiophytorum]